MKSRRIWRTGLIALGILAGAWAFAALLLPVLWPFLIGLAVSLLAEKPVRLLQTRARFPRWLASGVCVLMLFVLLFGGAFFLCRLLCTEAADLARQLPQLAEGLAPPVLRLKDRLLSLAEKLPDGLGKGLRAGVESFFQNGAGFGSKLDESLFSWASGIIGRLPDAVLFTVTAVLSSFMLSGELPAIRTWLRKLARPEWLEKLQRLGGHVRTTLGGWLRAQLKLMGITFLILNVGLLVLRVRYPLLAALVITVVDALPVFGTGTILIPWALVLFLRGQTKTGVGLVVLYGAAALSRQALEPRLVGKQVGLNPVLTLLALYTGYRLLGVGGMIVFPITAMLLKQIWDHSGLQPGGCGAPRLRPRAGGGIIAAKGGAADDPGTDGCAADEAAVAAAAGIRTVGGAGQAAQMAERAVRKRSARPYRLPGAARRPRARCARGADRGL